MDRETIRKANDLEARIKEVKQFLKVFKESANVKRGGGLTYIYGCFQIETKKSIKILGKKSFGFGYKQTEIKIPFDMIEMLEMVFKDKLNYLEERLKEL